MGSSFRWNDGEVWNRQRSARALRAWVPAFAGMTGDEAEWRLMHLPKRQSLLRIPNPEPNPVKRTNKKADAFASAFLLYVARPERFELPTTKFVAWCSIQLSYGR